MYNIVLHLCVCSPCEGLELLAAQSQTQDASCLPALRVSDVQPTIPVTEVQMGSIGTAPRPRAFKVSLLVFKSRTVTSVSSGGVGVQLCEQPTNGLVYFRAMCNLNAIPDEFRLYIPLYSMVLTK